MLRLLDNSFLLFIISCRQFSIFFIVYCVVVFAIGIQNIHESYGEVKAYHGRISRALSIQPKSLGQHSAHGSPSGAVVGDADTADDGPNAIEEARRDMKRLFYLPGLHNKLKNESSISSKMDCNEFVIEALLQCNAIDYDTDLEPILNVSSTSYHIIVFNHDQFSSSFSITYSTAYGKFEILVILSLFNH